MAVSFIPAPTPTVNLVMSLDDFNLLLSINTTCHVCNVSVYIHLSVNTSTSLVNYVSHNVRHVQRLKCVSFKSKVSVTCNFKYFSSSTLCTIFVAILFNTFFFTQAMFTSYRISLLRFAKLHSMMWTHFPFDIYVGYEFKNFEHYFNVFWWKKHPFEKKNKRRNGNSNNKRMSKVWKIDLVLSDDEIQFLHSLANSNFGCYCSRPALLV